MSASSASAPEIVRFFRGDQTDHCGRSLSESLGQRHDWLEFTHDYIQWLFPLTEASAFNSNAPILTPAAIAEFHADAVLRERLLSALRVMLDFYGLTLETTNDGLPRVATGSNFEMRKRNWLTPANHNYLHITRILKSLCLLGLSEQARSFLDCLLGIYEEHFRLISADTLSYWRNAVR